MHVHYKFSSCMEELLKYGSMELGQLYFVNNINRQPKELVYCAHDSALSINSHCVHIVMLLILLFIASNILTISAVYHLY